MFNRTFYTLQAKKALWFATMMALTAFAFVNIPLTLTLTPLALASGVAGIAAFHILPFLPLSMLLFIPLSPVLALISSSAVPFNLGFFGLIAYTIMSKNGKMQEAMKKTHNMGFKEEEKDILNQVEKLEKKTNIQIHEKKICDVDGKNFSPNAAASRTKENSIYVFSNIFKPPFTKKEIKAILAHEFGHIKHFDTLAHSFSSFLFWATCAFSFLAFSLPLALLATFTASYSYYAISQLDELLADQFSAQHANPKALISGLGKLKTIAKEMRKKDPEYETLWNKPKQYLHLAQSKIGMASHPPTKVRQSYLEAYAVEKEATKQRAKC